MHPEGFDLIGSFLCPKVLCGRYYSCLSSDSDCRFHFAGMMFQRSNEMFRYEQPSSLSQKLEKVVQCLFKPHWVIISVASIFIYNTDHFLIHNIVKGYRINILEEQFKSGEHNTDVTGNMETHPVPPSAKKVYSKPTLVVLSSNCAAGKAVPFQIEAPTPGATNVGNS